MTLAAFRARKRLMSFAERAGSPEQRDVANYAVAILDEEMERIAKEIEEMEGIPFYSGDNEREPLGLLVVRADVLALLRGEK